MWSLLQMAFNKAIVIASVVIMTVTAPFHQAKITPPPSPNPTISASSSAALTPSPASAKPVLKRSVQTPSPTPSQNRNNQLGNNCTEEEAQSYLKAHFPEGTKFDSSVQLSCDRDKSVQNTKPLQGNSE